MIVWQKVIISLLNCSACWFLEILSTAPSKIASITDVVLLIERWSSKELFFWLFGLVYHMTNILLNTIYGIKVLV